MSDILKATPAQSVYNPNKKYDLHCSTSPGGTVYQPNDQTACVISQPQKTHHEGTLPFTGGEAGLVALAGAVLLASGYGMRRKSRTE